MGQPERWNSVDEAVAEIESRRDDIDSVRIPIPQATYKAGQTVLRGGLMEIRMCDGSAKLVSIDVAEQILNNGLLNRLRIPIALELQKED